MSQTPESRAITPVPATTPVLDYKTPQPAPPPASDWSPLRNPIFRAMWIASAISYTGFEIRNYTAPLLMVDYHKRYGVSEGMAAYTFTASTLPIPLLVLFAGALADVVDRRKLLIFTHAGMMVAAALLGILTMCHAMPPLLMLGFLFVIGAGYAMMNPTLLAVIPELVQPSELRSALALNGLNMNIARVLGPLVGGLIVLICGTSNFYAGKGLAFVVTGLSLAGVIWVVMGWHPPERRVAANRETVWAAIRTGFKYTFHSPWLLAVLARVFIFIVCAGILQTFAGIICKNPANIAKLHGDTGAMIWMICFGLGAVGGVYLMQRLQRRFGIEEIVVICTLGFGLATIGVAHSPNLWVGMSAMFVAGFCWVIVPTNFNIATQLAVPIWIKGRAMGMYVLVLWGSFAAGSAIFGRLATAYGSRAALSYAGIGVLVGAIPILWLRLVPKSKQDFAPAKRPFAEPENIDDLRAGPVSVAYEYHVPAEQRGQFETLMRDLRRRRLQNGARRWSLENGLSNNGLHVFREKLIFRSWTERIRHHERTTQADLAAEQEVIALHTGEAPPAVTHAAYNAIPGIDGEPRPVSDVLADWADMVVTKAQREFVRLTERHERLRAAERAGTKD